MLDFLRPIQDHSLRIMIPVNSGGGGATKMKSTSVAAAAASTASYSAASSSHHHRHHQYHHHHNHQHRYSAQPMMVGWLSSLSTSPHRASSLLGRYRFEIMRAHKILSAHIERSCV